MRTWRPWDRWSAVPADISAWLPDSTPWRWYHQARAQNINEPTSEARMVRIAHLFYQTFCAWEEISTRECMMNQSRYNSITKSK
jgi:hypothetical protein